MTVMLFLERIWLRQLKLSKLYSCGEWFIMSPSVLNKQMTTMMTIMRAYNVLDLVSRLALLLEYFFILNSASTLEQSTLKINCKYKYVDFSYIFQTSYTWSPCVNSKYVSLKLNNINKAVTRINNS